MNEVIDDLIVKISKTDSLFSKEYFKIIQNFESSSVKTLLHALLSFFAFYISAIKAESIIPFLAVAPAPFIIERGEKEYNLVIDFMRVFLDHSHVSPRKRKRNRDIFNVRPYTSHFLREMSKYYEIISFCDCMPA